MIINNPQRYNIYEIEKQLKKGAKKFIGYLDNIYKLEGIDSLVTTLKASGIYLNIFNDEKINELSKSVTIYFEEKLDRDELIKFVTVIHESVLFIRLVKKFEKRKEEYFLQYPELDDSNKVIAYVLSLERFLSSINKEQVHDENWRKK